MVDFTVAICTYNGENRILDVLEKLRSQVGTEEISWEILIIDNNSTDNTAEVVQQQLSNWSEIYPLKYCFEAKQGLAFARRCAIRAAKSDLIGFLDDDNLPYSNWVAEAYKFGQTHENAGAYGGQIHGKFEVEPPPGFERIARFFAIIKGNQTYCYNEKYQSTKKRMFPPGAGIVIRKKAWLESIPEHPLLPQTNEDLEMLNYIWQKNWQLWFNPEMQLDHLIPKSRFEKEYLRNFFHQNGICRYYYRMLNYQPWQRPIISSIYMISDFSKAIGFYIKNRNSLKTDIVAIVEMELLISIALSPFYHWQQSVKQ
ncbi:glycosyltransferase family 2 protein [Anabaena cylindrica FACHB-243]|uniref:Glycosyl transferase family 2 n=1 Tax=Anabaena cylindrica (strain ATCC 27899 / PCC 7122) TaxID=272123 RepID=K9ZB66_ANACC|nr:MULTISPECIES: hormogonium polysaccharide biosynthesis glycosyltransferase HpsE [Anabaena]AFZ55625.1 glycosyl transferase family 2 [Anabaena cylindrica PCC 7122]MBD2420435.1 glycosyltransferase family 2 protein [Anabaena cylindrica FACHB-243]MBY5281837.1 glycosyltransferase family 2 protein [Anabaena sp. CCAP 1446/1C]MBY5310058.1 glycosyltransferase family 2 protein [Anabaena sp. CCAP 1446/1C]MCM2406939.1 hormogonium polysaccharide biosynthesis glycosyltransferase HpsE [Anabaena sp. CCAP 144